MSNRVKWAGLFSVLLLVFIMYRAVKPTGDQWVDPVVVPLVEGNASLSFRGLHATEDSVVVVGGNLGTFGFSLDAGLHWVMMRIPGADSSQFRSVWALNNHEFVAVSAGAPTYIYHTSDRGHHWERTYSDTAASTFLDGVVFADDSLGFAYGDPVDGNFKLLQTTDGGRSWAEITGPEAIDGEASFAASGSGVRWHNGVLSINSGGSVSRLHYSADSGATWNSVFLELIQGLPSQGAFAHAFNGDELVIVGGDYMVDTATAENALWLNWTEEGSEEGEMPQWATSLPYTSDVEFDEKYGYFTGTTGVYWSDSSGLHAMDTTAMHSLAYSGKYMFMSGAHGRIGRVFYGTNEALQTLLKAVKEAQKRQQ